jgi:Flp pilus assembly protein TadG
MTPLLMIVFGLIQYSFYFWALQGGADVTRQAARLAAVGQPIDNSTPPVATCALFRSKVIAQLGAVATNPGAAVVTRTYESATPGTVQIGDTVTVTVSFTSSDFNLPFVPFISDGRVTNTATARVDYVPGQPETCT